MIVDASRTIAPIQCSRCDTALALDARVFALPMNAGQVCTDCLDVMTRDELDAPIPFRLTEKGKAALRGGAP